MVTYVGICDVIDWEQFIKDLENQTPGYVGPRHDVGHEVPGVEEVAKPLRDAGYKMADEGGNARWDMFLPGKNFDTEIVEKFCNWVGMSGFTNCWVSRIMPGDVAPWHWDITDHEETLDQESTDPDRYHVHMCKPQPGHISIIEDNCLYLQEQGATYKWPSRKSWHCGANAGLVPKYQFNIWR